MRITVEGTIQGVGFRPAVYRAALRCGASGTVRNDGSQVVIETDKGDELVRELLSSLPPLAVVESIDKESIAYNGPAGFRIIESDGQGNGASIPADSAICDECIDEMMSSGRRHGYPFTTCTGCGPRFTLLSSVPYDRCRTSMSSFPMCPECGMEFSDPEDRRFHHQTVACPSCGPGYRLVTPDGVVTDDPIGKLAGMLDNGCRAIVKGWGGTHICCIPERLRELRDWYGRERKPFAMMIRDADAIRRYGDPTDCELEMLLSPGRPIVLCEKKPSEIADLLSPGLDTIGIFLPYTGMHHILFSKMEHDALVMTSANPPGEPMAVKNEDALKIPADAWLFHDQTIINRADDSVVRMLGGRTQFIRRSRGYIPYHLDAGRDGDAIALGAQENLSGAIASDGRIWPTQFIGNGEKIGVPEYLEEAVRTMVSMVGCEPESIAVDLHPGYANRKIARALSEELTADIIEVQHHWAHAASLLIDNNKEHCIALALDGTGHGDDGTAWGGEVLQADFDGYKRLGHLQPIPLLGSDRALYDLRRLGFAIDEMNGAENNAFTDQESTVLRKLMPRSVVCSSMGRVLDALAYKLGVCSVRTYDGEPAMSLEPLLRKGRLIKGYVPEIKNRIVKTAELLGRINPEDRKEDVAYSIVHGIMQSLVDMAADCGEDNIGITGGVSYNSVISSMFVDMVKSNNMHPLIHKDVPNGDGGIAVGQAAIAIRRKT